MSRNMSKPCPEEGVEARGIATIYFCMICLNLKTNFRISQKYMNMKKLRGAILSRMHQVSARDRKSRPQS